MTMACGNCCSFLLWAPQKTQITTAALVQDDACARVQLQSMATVGGKQVKLHRSASICSTASGDGSDGNSEGGDTAMTDDDTTGSNVKLDCNFGCPHCFRRFETAEALYQHDTCMAMPSKMVDSAKSGDGSIVSVGLKLDGKIQCSHCSQKFDTEKALSLHCKFIHNGDSLMNTGYTLSYEFNSSKVVNP